MRSRSQAGMHHVPQRKIDGLYEALADLFRRSAAMRRSNEKLIDSSKTAVSESRDLLAGKFGGMAEHEDRAKALL